MAVKNYYLILGVKSNATMKQIREAYRRLAKELHPDYYGQDSGPFIDLQEAYAILSDPTRRRAYDDVQRSAISGQSGAGRDSAEPLYARKPVAEPLMPKREQADLGELSLSQSFQTFGPSFDELFDRLWRNFSLDKPEAERLRSLNATIRISPEEALQGGRVRILVPARLKCPVCYGHRSLGFYECWQCAGAGTIHGEYPVNLVFPPGIINDFVIEIPLDQFGISNFFLRAIFRVSDSVTDS